MVPEKDDSMTTVGEIYQSIDRFAPFRTAMDFDNCGLQAGSGETEVQTALLSLDITPDVVREAAERGAQLIVSHHPVIFHPLRSLRPGTPAYLLVRHGIAAICAHTNLDLADGGVNTSLAKRIGLKNVKPLAVDGSSGLPSALEGETDRTYGPREFAEFVKRSLGCDGLFYADGGRKIGRVGLCGGAGSEFVPDAAARGCQAFVTGEAKHHELIDAENRGVTLVAAGHFYTENVVIGPLAERLGRAFPAVKFLRAERSHCPAHYL